MKFLRILAALLAMMLVCGSCLADETEVLQGLIDGMIEEALNDDSDDSDDSEYIEHDATLLPYLDFSLDDWLDTSYMRAMFSVLLMLEITDAEELDVDGLIDEYGIPDVYLAGPAEGDYGDPIYAFYFFDDDDVGKSVTVIYYTSDGTYSGFVSDYYGYAETYMEAFHEEGICGEYYEISTVDFYTAMNDLTDILSED